MRYFLELSYNGKAYHGWQNQPNAISVQEVIEKALSTILKEKISIMGAGRTDTGVHAKQMYAHFDFDGDFNDHELLYKLNSFLPKDVALHRIFPVKADAHTRFHAESRTYLYRIALQKNVFNFDEAYWVKPKLNIKNMTEAANILLEYKDFQSFSKSNTDVKTYNCNIMAVHLETVDNELHFTITADRFLRNMVRAIVGTLINVGLGKLEVTDIHRIISSKNRSEAGYSVPAQGLYLTRIIYPESIVL
ncbi:tRNA pseudouridine synthase A [Formosa agariphila KMM 3901]|uniref:tRNA pseudouridine synthase A n=1 Tax=Formosa agariphila (strain DSM 15362 / KCTC 12365 / LMG 23005 / KMM 3901 / M-2Alg 35-1) TaxID=1347342 RepID=T2KPK4_FORAG|nr:tRNA pseudouridine(38-40) synthase TruA [Formosa agariphila]CDF80423.1 tRNA pseudouridine synthase A [Formosa agariphila KMM 3901]